MKHKAIVGNIGHFDNEIDMAGLAKVPGRRAARTIKPQVDEWTFPDGDAIIVLSEGRLLNLGNATGHPSLRDVELVHQPGDRPDRAVHQDRRSTTMRRLRAAQAPRREGRPAAPRRARRASSPSSPRSRPTTSASPWTARTSRSTTATDNHLHSRSGPPGVVGGDQSRSSVERRTNVVTRLPHLEVERWRLVACAASAGGSRVVSDPVVRSSSAASTEWPHFPAFVWPLRPAAT